MRVCQVISNILKELDEDMEIEDELWQSLQSALLMRSRDKIANVRVEAAKGLTRLQVGVETHLIVSVTCLRTRI